MLYDVFLHKELPFGDFIVHVCSCVCPLIVYVEVVSWPYFFCDFPMGIKFLHT